MLMADDSIFSNYNYRTRGAPSSSQQQQQQNKKKKSRGNRQLQRYRRKLRDQGMDTNMIVELTNSDVNVNQLKTDVLTQHNEQITKSIAYPTSFDSLKLIKKMKPMKKNINEKHTIIKKKKNQSSKSVSMKKVKTPIAISDSIDYASIPDEIFSQMLSSIFNGKEKLNCFSNEDEKIKFIRHFTSLIDRLSYVQLQDFQWKYYHYIGMTQNIWKGSIRKHLAEKYSVCHTYGRSKTIIEQRLQQIEQHLQQAQNAIQQFEQEILSKCAQYEDGFFVMKELSSIIYEFVQNKQQSLQHEFKYKREMLIFDATDHQLIQNFFNIKPNKSQIISAKRIWEATMQQMKIEEDIALFEHRLTSTNSQIASNLVGQMIDNLDKTIQNLNETIKTTPTNCAVSNEIKQLEALKKTIIHQAILTSYEMIENFKKIIQIEQNTFLLTNRFMESTSDWQKMVLDAIVIRRLHMIKRANFNIQHILAISSNVQNDH